MENMYHAGVVGCTTVSVHNTGVSKTTLISLTCGTVPGTGTVYIRVVYLYLCIL